MGKELSEMTVEELWQLFPIFLVEHKDSWKEDYKEIETELQGILAGYRVDRISHVGSTSIKNIWAKDIVDVLIEISKDENMEVLPTWLILSTLYPASIPCSSVSISL